MKKISSFLVLVIILLVTNLTFAAQKHSVNKNVEDNLINGLNSENLGLATSSAYYLGEFGTNRCIIPLMKVLKNGKTDEERISAAVALSKINSPRAIFAVKQRAKYDDSERVRRLCENFYQQSLQVN